MEQTGAVENIVFGETEEEPHWLIIVFKLRSRLCVTTSAAVCHDVMTSHTTPPPLATPPSDVFATAMRPSLT